MNLFLLGNGFDLYHNLPTKYENFLHTMEYIINNSDKNFAEIPIGEIFESLSKDGKDSFIEESYEKYKSAYDEIVFEQQDYEAILGQSNNMWLKYFVNSFNKELGWIDFEKEIAIVIGAFEDLFDFLNQIKLSYDLDFGKYYLNKKGNYYSHIIKQFPFFFETKQKYNAMYSQMITQYVFLKEYLNSKYGSNVLEINTNKVIKHLYDELQKLNVLLCIYLKYFVDKPLSQLNKSVIVKKNKMFEKADVVVTFNYTNTYECLYKNNESSDRKVKKIFHIHGNIQNNIVLGVNPNNYDELAEINTDYIMFKKYFQRIIYKTDEEYLSWFYENSKTDTQDNKAYNTPNIINKKKLFVCGHSLDITDEDIIKQLFDISEEIYIVCHNEIIIGNYVRNLISIYGKNELDRIRKEKCLNFIDYNTLIDCVY